MHTLNVAYNFLQIKNECLCSLSTHKRSKYYQECGITDLEPKRGYNCGNKLTKNYHLSAIIDTGYKRGMYIDYICLSCLRNL